MERQSYLIFRVKGLRYGIETSRVREVFKLPELTPIADAPPDILGILNLRGNLLPVMSLERRLGQTMQPCRTSDSIIAVTGGGIEIGAIVREVLDVFEIATEAIAREVEYGRQGSSARTFFAGIAKLGADAIAILDVEALIRSAETAERLEAAIALSPESEKLRELASDELGANAIAISDVEALRNAETAEELEAAIALSPESEKLRELASDERQPNKEVVSNLATLDFYELYCPNATAIERETFRKRAEDLAHAPTDGKIAEMLPLAVFGLGEEYFGVELNAVREFIDVRQVTPIPCCPPHILGNTNLRGEIMTLVDIRPPLSLPVSGDRIPKKAIVVQVDDIVAGITVDEVFDVTYVYPDRVTSVPAAVPAARKEYFRGTVPHGEQMLSILDLPKLLQKKEMTVNEMV